MTQLYSESAMGYRRNLPGIASIKSEGHSMWLKLDGDITMKRDSTAFVGRDKTSGKIALVNGDNTGNLIMGFLDTGKFESDMNTKNLQKLDNWDQFDLKEGEEYPLWNNSGMQYRIQVEGADADTKKANMAKLVVGQRYDFMLDTNGVQQLKCSATGQHCVFICDDGGGYARVELAQTLITVTTGG